MEIKFEFKLEDFKKLVNEMGSFDYADPTAHKKVIVKNQVVEKDDYMFEISGEQAYNHESKIYIPNGKIKLKIKTLVKQ